MFQLRPSLAPFLFGLPFAVLWFALINELRVEWSVDPQYAYGWAVPFLCAYLLWKRGSAGDSPAVAAASTAAPLHCAARGGAGPGEAPPPSCRFHGLFFLLAFLLLPLRLLQEASPQWRLGIWFVALDVIGLTLLALHLVSRISDSGFRISHAAFPICFFLVAVPWPTTVEWPVIQGLTRSNVAISIELLNWAGLPAMQHGNVIETGAGLVGIDEACSGIRSFQATLMISLFLGELYRMGVARRIWFCLAGFVMAFLFNLCRTLLLVVVASREGIAAAAQWHDPAGVTILVACFLCLWLLSFVLGRRKAVPASPSAAVVSPDPPHPLGPRGGASDFSARFGPWSWLFTAFAVWVVLVAVGVEVWFRVHEVNLPHNPVWTAVRPAGNPTTKEVPIDENARKSLRFSEAMNLRWTEPDQTRWQMVFLRWDPGQVAAHLAQVHTPDGCLTASGRELLSMSDIRFFEAGGIRLPFRSYVFRDGQQFLHVFFCIWQDRASQQYFEKQELRSFRGRLDGVWTGQRNLGQRSLEIAVWGIDDPAAAAAAVQRQLASLIKVEK